MTRILHLITDQDWASARNGLDWRPPSLEAEGFIHCSEDWNQVRGVVRRLYPGRTDMLVLEVETGQLQAQVVREPSRSGEIYPHIYGPLNLDAVAAVWQVRPDDNGDCTFSPGS